MRVSASVPAHSEISVYLFSYLLHVFFFFWLLLLLLHNRTLRFWNECFIYLSLTCAAGWARWIEGNIEHNCVLQIEFLLSVSYCSGLLKRPTMNIEKIGEIPCVC